MFILKPLSDRRIACLWGGQLLSATGAEFYMVAVIWSASALIGRDAGYVSALQAALLLIGSLFGGIVTDRWSHRATMIAVSLGRAALLLILSGAAAAGLMSLPLLAGIAALVALATSAYDPALQASLPLLAPEASRHATNGLFDATRRMARIAGPSLIALINGIMPIGQFFLITAAGFVFAALGVGLALRGMSMAVPLKAGGAGGDAAVFLDRLIGGLRAIRGHRLMYYGLAGDLVGNVSWSMGVLLGMALYLRANSADPLTDYGLMMTAYGCGNLGANLALASLRPRRPALWLVMSKLTFGAGVMLLPLAPDRAWLMAFAAFAAINGPLENLALLHIIQRDFPQQRIAQVYRLLMCAAFAGLLVGYLSAPGLFGAFGLRPIIMASGAATLAIGLMGARLASRTLAVPQQSGTTGEISQSAP
ncbi:MAG TPA: MFS transporter [Terriglobales bacterium]|nr:MFS transporter [Terriglobales bacterium]